MAYYTFRCPICKAEYIEKRSIDERNNAPTCCGAKTERIQSPVAGWVCGESVRNK